MALDKGSQFLSDLVLYRTYSATKSDGMKETRSEMYDRVGDMHKRKYPHLEKDIDFAINLCKQNKVLGSQRAAQFAGAAIEKENLRMYNCAFLNVETFQDISEFLFILACGTGCGISVKHRHISKLPTIETGYVDNFQILDTKESWADSISVLLRNPQVIFDYSLIRPAGSILSSGGTASGPEPLKQAHDKIKALLVNAQGRQLRPVEVFDICGHIADVIVAGGSRRSACIALFDADDQEMLTAKFGNWWETNSQRGRFNISAHILRADDRAAELFNNTLDSCFQSNSGEPGILWTNDLDEGTQPCVELSLRNNGLCNLSEVNVAACFSFNELAEAVKGAVILGTLQAGYVDFGYIKGKWRENCLDEALLGVSLTGLAENWDLLLPKKQFVSFPDPDTGIHELAYIENVFAELTRIAKETNSYFAKAIGIKEAARICCVKPSGTASAFVGCTSGIHAAHSEFYIRRVQIEKTNPVSIFLSNLPEMAPFIVENVYNSNEYKIEIPIGKFGAITRTSETALELLERAKFIAQNWIHPTHARGDNRHNVSLTVSYKKEEEQEIKNWMWENKNEYNGISLLPFSGGSYQQMPFEEISKEKYLALLDIFPEVDLSMVNYKEEVDRRNEEKACAGPNGCEWGT